MTTAFGVRDRVRVRCMPQPTDTMNTCMYAVSIERVDRVYDAKLVYLNQLLRADPVSSAQSITKVCAFFKMASIFAISADN